MWTAPWTTGKRYVNAGNQSVSYHSFSSVSKIPFCNTSVLRTKPFRKIAVCKACVLRSRAFKKIPVYKAWVLRTKAFTDEQDCSLQVCLQRTRTFRANHRVTPSTSCETARSWRAACPAWGSCSLCRDRRVDIPGCAASRPWPTWSRAHPWTRHGGCCCSTPETTSW